LAIELDMILKARKVENELAARRAREEALE
jgi:hypothetical protein